MKPYLKNFLVFALISLLYGSGFLNFFERKLDEYRFWALPAEATGDLVVAEIDPRSLDQIGVWPWPRSIHAQILDRLFDAGANEVALDIDFSSPSIAAEDAAFAEALRRHGDKVILPVFKQQDRANGLNRANYNEPLPQFRQYTQVASLNVTPDADGAIRQMAVSDRWPNVFVPRLPAVLADAERGRSEVFYIDYGIRASSLPHISVADLLKGTFDAGMVRGRRVIVGSTAAELGDMLSVPAWQNWSVLPGAYVQAVATESLMQGRDLQRVPWWVVVMGALLISLFPGIRFRVWSGLTGLFACALVILGAQALAIAVQAQWPLLLDTTPLMLAAVGAYAVGLTGRIEDQSVRLLAQGLALKHQDAFMRRVVNNTFDGLLTIDGLGTIRSFNPAAQRIFGHTPEETIGQNFSTLLTGTAGFGEGSGAATSLLAAVARSGVSRGIMGRRHDGTAFPMDLAVTEMQEGGASVYIALVRDISARAAAESMAAEAQQRLVDALESISEAFVLYDSQDRIVLFNQRFRDLHGPCANLIAVGNHFEEVARAVAAQGQVPEAAGRIQEWVRERVMRHTNPQGSFEMELADGRWLRINERRTGDGGIVGTLVEITDEKRRERELRRTRDAAELANRSKSEFLANMSHELRTPLNAIIGFSELMKNEVLGPINVPAYTGYVRDIHDSASHLLNIINDILDLSRIEAGKLKLFEAAVDLGAAVQATVRLISDRANDAGVRVTAEIGPELPQLWGDERLVKQILINLLANAVKFTPRGGNVAARAFLDADGRLTLSVADTGIGIAEADLARVMEPFGQADGSLRRRYDGTGLGLPLVRSFVDLHGATFDLKSQVGAGTVATVLFPPQRTVQRQTGDASRKADAGNVTTLRSAGVSRE